VPLRGVNRAEEIWGSDAKLFAPERWLNGDAGLPERARAVQGTNHLLTFVDGPRICLGRAFALAEFKSVLSVLIRNYTFALRDGPDTAVETDIAILPRPRVVGEAGGVVPLVVRHCHGN